MPETRQWDVTSKDGFVDCYDATFADAYRYAMRLVGGDRTHAEDLVQDTYLSLLQTALAGGVESVGTGWVITRVRHRFLDLLRSSSRENRRLRQVATAPMEPETTFASTSVLGMLSDRERTALLLRYIDDLPVADVAELLGISLHAAESLLQRAKRKARESEVRDA